MTNNIVLFEPQIHGNTGNIARTSAATNSKLHLIKPLGFDLDDKRFKRSGVDYWKNVDLTVYENIQEFFKSQEKDSIFYYVTKYSKINYTDNNYATNTDKDIYFIFGKESTGLPVNLIEKNKNNAIRIPQNDDHVRSLNLANSVSIVIYEALRQQNFSGMDPLNKHPFNKI